MCKISFIFHPILTLLFLLACFSPGSSKAQISADHWNGGGVRIGPSTTVCDVAAEGAIRYNTTSDSIEFCNGVAWTTFVQTQSSVGPTAPAGSGYFVMTHTTWDGNLGGLSGADSKCLTELGTTYTSWRGYSAANTAGQITAQKVKAFLCDDYNCNNLMPLTTYYFAYANDGTPGGASFTTDATGRGPNNSTAWSAANYFSGTYSWWSGRQDDTGSGLDPLQWYNVSGGYSCYGGWSSSSVSYDGIIGNTSTTDSHRWWSTNGKCNTSNRLICFVNP